MLSMIRSAGLQTRRVEGTETSRVGDRRSAARFMGSKHGKRVEEALHEPDDRSAGCPTCGFADCQSAAWTSIERSRIAERSRVGNPRNGRLGSLRYDNAGLMTQ